MQDAGFPASVLAAAREIEAAEGQAMAETWWRGVEQGAAEMAHDLNRRREGRDTGRVDVRWRSPTRLPVLVRWGLGDLFRVQAPESMVERLGDVVRLMSPCGQRLLLPVDEVVFCPDDCGRWVLRLGDGRVLVKRWPREAVAA